MILAHITRSLRETFPGRASEWALAVMLFNWSLVLTLNPDVFQNASYVALARVLPQEGWSLVCLVAGGGRLIVLAVNGAWRRSPHMRAGMAFLSCFFWFQITVGFLGAGTFSTGLAIYPVLFLLDTFNVIRAMGEAGRSDAQHQRMTGHGTDG